MAGWFLALLGLVLVSCSTPNQASDPRAFVEAYSQACQRGDAEALWRMRPDQAFYRQLARQKGLLPGASKELESFSKPAELEFLKGEVKAQSPSILAWKDTRFESVRSDQGRCLMVLVRVGDMSTTICLIRDEQQQLKLFPMADTSLAEDWARAAP